MQKETTEGSRAHPGTSRRLPATAGQSVMGVQETLLKVLCQQSISQNLYLKKKYFNLRTVLVLQQNQVESAERSHVRPTSTQPKPPPLAASCNAVV